MQTKIKICGITNLKDAIDAINAGANALGFVFYHKSPRYIEPFEARKIIEQLPPFIQSVGLFVEESAQNINHISKIAKIDLAQIHFEANDELYNNLEVKYIKVLRAQSRADILKYQDNYILVDAFVESYGGEGKRLNLEWFKDVNCSKMILAGGLQGENLQELNGFGFYGVDVSSGVEASKGKKDKQKMIKFCKEANEIS
ncbi:MAG: phosphoribosylanthranilate isomerase [Arcobacteraceae bacterium]|nr:phosphoribosylanthranilate isomerase [Arcobacteraceae bacterium]